MKKNPTDKILMFLKMRGEATSLIIADELAITKEGARKHLLSLSAEGLVKATVKSSGVGRPSTFYSLTENGMARFPDTHADVTVQLLRSVKNVLGENALNLLISDRESVVYERYEKALAGTKTLDQKLKILSQKRSEEGYMAEWKKDNDTYFLIENHCPICAAATECQGFCRSELNNFRELLGPEYRIERTEYIIDNGKRCTYKIEKV
ncbi:transcriptional regulator [Elizabethkingia meningoseptica]|uniref:helix-turn-helix transcriptional regulator n=1 Tax=Elizabethkingia meningoseptica TaxID=238 RepID=UPI0008A85163|nr:metalloregulator ArsR/SmtB family transcription factor [Elizabethkingia meningoseptica]MDE5429432.1 transcriptional regulator [Elizabethkingia meningoseptica]MDE5451113.1 transcriptional regulator [Elizabethkingia meningoseptica]MDE5470853.1 transcriptional regulator [Elizabethkingia meningoseptica]MDE5519657.1 transcriptional regulator [Elizabethkingia meningoseptica]MDE5524321.1 transcriptional regulator [Elizabethkingia meningoseptica]